MKDIDEYTVLIRLISLLLTQKFFVEILVAVNFNVTKNGSDSNKIITWRMWQKDYNIVKLSSLRTMKEESSTILINNKS